MPRLPLPRESVIQRAVLSWLAVQGIRAWRINQSGVPLHDGSGRYRPGPTRGLADIIGLLPGGRFLAIECKRSDNKPTEAQQAFLDDVAARGGVAIVAKSVDDVESVLLPLLRRERDSVPF